MPTITDALKTMTVLNVGRRDGRLACPHPGVKSRGAVLWDRSRRLPSGGPDYSVGLICLEHCWPIYRDMLGDG